MILTTGISNRHVKALSKYVINELAKDGIKLSHQESDEENEWILLDYLDVIVHVFDKNKREFYDLDRIWSDAKKINVDIN